MPMYLIRLNLIMKFTKIQKIQVSSELHHDDPDSIVHVAQAVDDIWSQKERDDYVHKETGPVREDVF